MNKTLQQLTRQRFATWRTVVFFILLVGLSACKDDRLLGLEVQPEGALDPIQKVDSFSVTARTVLLDESQISSRFQNFIGLIDNTVFGKSTASLYLNFILESENISLDLAPENYIVDSLVFTFKPTSVYGDPTEVQTLNVWVVDEEIRNDSNYTSSRIFATEETPIGTTIVSFESKESYDELRLKSTYKGISIALDTNFGKYLLQGIGSAYSTTTELQEYFRGFHISVEDNAAMNGGAIYNYDVLGAGNGLTLYYHPAADTTVEARESLSFLTSSSTARINNFQHDRSGALVESFIGDAVKGRNLLFVQGMSGVRSEIYFPYITNFAASTDVAVSLARIKLPTSDVQASGLGYAPKLYLLDFEIDPATGDTLETLNLDYTFSTSRHGGEISEDNTEYIFDVTRQIQKIIESAQSGGNANLGFTLNAQVPVLNGNVQTQTVLQGSDNIVLELFYTDINE